jgi:tripartite-type tricarboxylate transporter receptor subunit TctC
MIKKVVTWPCCFLFLLWMSGATLVHSQQGPYPNRPIRLVVPAAPGGGTDILARQISKKLSEQLGQPVVIENKAGAGGIVGSEQVARAAPDGYTLLIGTVAAFGMAPSLMKSMPFDPVKDFSHITQGVIVTNVLVVHPSVKANSVQEFLALARAQPGVLNYSTSGVGSGAFMAGELFSQMGQVDITHVPYKGGGLAVAGLVSGHVQFSFATAPSVIPLIQAGRLKALAVTSTERFAYLADTPTLSETIMPGFEASNWYAFFAPANTPKPIVDRLNKELGKVLADPEIAKVLLEQGMQPTPSTSEGLQAFVQQEVLKWAALVKARGIAPE